MKTTTQSSTSTLFSKDSTPDRTNKQHADQATPWSFYFLMAMLGLGLLLMLGMAVFSL